MDLVTIPQTPILGAIFFFFAGMAMLIFPPKNSNGIYGYRTPLSISSQQRWTFAQRYSANRLVEAAVILVVASFGIGLFNMDADSKHIIGILLIFLVGASLFIRTEIAIKKQYPNT